MFAEKSLTLLETNSALCIGRVQLPFRFRTNLVSATHERLRFKANFRVCRTYTLLVAPLLQDRSVRIFRMHM